MTQAYGLRVKKQYVQGKAVLGSFRVTWEREISLTEAEEILNSLAHALLGKDVSCLVTRQRKPLPLNFFEQPSPGLN